MRNNPFNKKASNEDTCGATVSVGRMGGIHFYDGGPAIKGKVVVVTSAENGFIINSDGRNHVEVNGKEALERLATMLGMAFTIIPRGMAEHLDACQRASDEEIVRLRDKIDVQQSEGEGLLSANELLNQKIGEKHKEVQMLHQALDEVRAVGAGLQQELQRRDDKRKGLNTAAQNAALRKDAIRVLKTPSPRKR